MLLTRANLYIGVLLAWYNVAIGGNSGPILLTVDNEGCDCPSCLNGSLSCGTLSYVLMNTDKLPQDEAVTVNITADQEIDPLATSVSISGQILFTGDNKSLYFHKHVSTKVLFYSEIAESKSNLSFSGINFYSANFNFSNLFTVHICNCNFYETIRVTSSVERFKITSTGFFNSNLTSELLHITGGNKETFYVAIEHSLFENNCGNDYLTYFGNKPYQYVEIYINNVIYSMNNAPCLHIHLPSDFTYGGNYQIKNSTFVNNFISSKVLTNIVYMSFSAAESFLEVENVHFKKNVIGSTSFVHTTSVFVLGNPEISQSNGHALFKDTIFFRNTGTPLTINSINTTFVGFVNFSENSGILGGGIRKHGGSLNMYEENSLITFAYNNAILGGAIFIDKYSCNMIGHCVANSSIKLLSNLAATGGTDIYFEDPLCLSDKSNFSCFEMKAKISTGPKYIEIQSASGSENITLFPGQLVKYNPIIRDDNNNKTFCKAQVILQCGTNIIVCHSAQHDILTMTGATYYLITEDNETANSYLSTNSEHSTSSGFDNPRLIFQCTEVDAMAYLNIHLIPCPLGYIYSLVEGSFVGSEKLGRCKCSPDPNIKCDNVSGVACVIHSFWYGEIVLKTGLTKNITAACEYPYCKSLQSCPIEGTGSYYNKLPVKADDQCVGLSGGMLCRDCQNDAHFTFLSVKCIHKSSCKNWHPYFVLLLAILLQFLWVIFIVLISKIKAKIGSGYIYGPLFFTAVVGKIPFGVVKDFEALKVTVSLFQSVYLLNLEIFGEFPLCFFYATNHRLYNYLFRFMGPAIIFLVLIFAVVIARKFPKYFLILQDSPVQIISLFGVLICWSLVDICANILSGILIEGELRVFLQPTLGYFRDPVHILASIISLVLGVFVILPFVFILLFSQLLSCKFNLSRIQPFLDELQSCYDDNFRWFSGVYLLSWMILNVIVPLFLLILCLVLVCSLHFMLHPYKKKWMNALDSVLLIDLIIIFLLFNNVYDSHTSTGNALSDKSIKIMIYLLVLIPLSGIGVGGGVWFISKTSSEWFKRMMPMRTSVHYNRKRSTDESVELLQSSTCTPASGGFQINNRSIRKYDPTHERESLIRIIQEAKQ